MIDFEQATVRKQLARHELPDYLRELADSLEGGDDACGCGVSLGEFHSIAMSLAVEGEDVNLSIDLAQKDADDGGTAQDAEGLPQIDYSRLKKRMKSSFKTIFKAIHLQRKPPARSVESFLRDARTMVRFPGKGDDYYAEFLKCCYEFEAAYNRGDTEAVHRACDALNHTKTECHTRYK